MRYQSLSCLVIALLAGCESPDSGQMQMPTQESANAIGRCKKSAPNVEICDEIGYSGFSCHGITEVILTHTNETSINSFGLPKGQSRIDYAKEDSTT